MTRVRADPVVRAHAAIRAVLPRLSWLRGGTRLLDDPSDRLAIMAKKVVEVRDCDRCGQEPAHQWTITGPDRTVREIDLCDRHGAPVANAFALAKPVTKRERYADHAVNAGRRVIYFVTGQPHPART